MSALADTFPRDLGRVRIGAPDLPYKGWHALMTRRPDLAVTTADRVAPITPALWDALADVQRRVNRAMTPRPDGAVDHWPSGEEGDRPGAGDCDDHVMRKRWLLAQRGLPLGALLPFVADGPPSVGLHALLLIRTSRGHVILDNLRTDIAPWAWLRREYTPRKILSPTSTTLWRLAS